ncbi:MAG: DUF4961 domain-containing protein, partial [Sphingobacteriaceae bacterium]
MDGLKDPDGNVEKSAGPTDLGLPAWVPWYGYFANVTGPALTVSGGTTGEYIDYQSPVLAFAEPGSSLIDDFVTFTFDGGVQITDLYNASEVYLRATAIDTEGTEYPVTAIADKTKMVEVFPQSNQYKLTVWPRSYFNIPSTKTIARVTYTIVDKTGTKVVGVSNNPNPNPMSLAFVQSCQEAGIPYNPDFNGAVQVV